MTALPSSPPPAPSPAFNNNNMHAFLTEMRDFLAGILGTAGTVPAALAALGAMIGAGVVTRTATGSLTAADRGRLVLASGTITLTLPTVAAAGNGWSVLVDNTGSGTVTLDGASAETVDGAATVALPRGRAAFVICTGSAWVTVALPGSAGGPVLGSPGAAPGFAFGGDEDTGVGSPGADQLGLMAGNVYRTILSTTALTTTVPVLAPSGTAAAPGVAFSASPGMGLFRVSNTVMGMAVNGVAAAHLTSTGRIGLGTAAPTNRLHIAGATDADSWVLMERASDDASPARIMMRKSRGTLGAPAALGAGDRALTIISSGHDGTGFFSMAEIAVTADAAFTAGSTPGRMVFSTTPVGSTSMAERLRLDEAGAKVTGRIEANGAPIWGRQVVVANNAVATITPPFTGGRFLIAVGGGVGATVTDDGACADLHIDCGTTPFIEKASGWATRGTLVNTSYAVLTGTTGSVGFLTVSPQNNGTFLVENRLGASKTVRIWGL